MAEGNLALSCFLAGIKLESEKFFLFPLPSLLPPLLSHAAPVLLSTLSILLSLPPVLLPGLSSHRIWGE